VTGPADAPDLARLRVRISGRVQGVGFRYFAQRHGAALGLSGMVRNTDSGDVEVLAEGPRDTLLDLIALLREGPRMAFVAHIAVEWSDPRGDLPSPFAIGSTLW
jgi:acylphosphatase